MLTPIVAPTTSNLMAPATVLARLKLPESELDEVADQVAEASGIVARYLGFRPEYGTWRETFTGVHGDRLYLGARPVWSVEGVTYRDGSASLASSYRLDRGAYGESSLVSPYGTHWGTYGYDIVGDLLVAGGFSSLSTIPDWSIDYTAGWWLEEMTGEPPAGVDRFPRELQADFLRVVRWLRSGASDLGEMAALGISKMTNEGASIEFETRASEGYEERLLPIDLHSLPLYRRAV